MLKLISNLTLLIVEDILIHTSVVDMYVTVVIEAFSRPKNPQMYNYITNTSKRRVTG